jgi:glycosyltransferase involved in cell wall biosynthesis
MCKVSVIVPNYNHLPYLERRLQSILDQTYQDFEIIFLDDASTDNSLEVFSKFSDNPRIRSILNDTNSGSPFKQWNKGIRGANGEYIWIAESDDYADPRFLETLVPVLDDNPSVGLAYCQSWRIDENDNTICSCRDTIRYSDRTRWQGSFIAPGEDECMKYMLFENIIPNASAVLTRRGVFESIGYASEDFRLTGDWMTWMRILMTTNVAYISQPLSYFRCHPKSVRSTTLSDGLHLEEKYKVLDYIFNLNSGDPGIKENVCQVYYSAWINASFNPSCKIPWSRQFTIYNYARQFDSAIHQRLLTTFIHRGSAKMRRTASGLFRRIKSFLRFNHTS